MKPIAVLPHLTYRSLVGRDDGFRSRSTHPTVLPPIVEERPRCRKHVAEHAGSEHARARVVARAVIADENAQAAHVMGRAMAERRGRAAMVERRQRAFVRDPPE